jgi:hypothetical protein
VSNVGRWDFFYADKPEHPFGYDDSPAFKMGADFLADCETVADWGCGGGNFSRFVEPERYVGVDGSKTWAVSVVADLEEYRGESDGIFLRGVLEHNYKWDKVLENALASFRKRMVLVFFTDFHAGPEDAFELSYELPYGVPTLAFRQGAIEAFLDGFIFELHQVKSMHHIDHVYLIERP